MDKSEVRRMPTRESKMGYYDLPHETDGGGSNVWLTIKALALVFVVLGLVSYLLL